MFRRYETDDGRATEVRVRTGRRRLDGSGCHDISRAEAREVALWRLTAKPGSVRFGRPEADQGADPGASAAADGGAMSSHPALDEIEATSYETDVRARLSGVRWRDNREPSTRGDPLGGRDCWCGEPGRPDWPGKADGAPHPGGSRP